MTSDRLQAADVLVVERIFCIQRFENLRTVYTVAHQFAPSDRMIALQGAVEESEFSVDYA